MARQSQDQAGDGVHTGPTEEQLPPDRFIADSGVAFDEGGGGRNSRLMSAVAGQADPESLTEAGDGEGPAVSITEEAIGQKNGETAPGAPILLPGQELGLRGEARDEADLPQEKTRGPCQGSCLVKNMEGSVDKQLSEEGQPSVRAEAVGQQPSLGQRIHSGEAVEGTAAAFRREEKGEAAV